MDGNRDVPMDVSMNRENINECPRCKTGGANILRERHIDGNTSCNVCGLKLKHRDWNEGKINPPLILDDEKAAEAVHRMALGRDLITRFTYHEPKPGQVAIYDNLRSSGKELAVRIAEVTPICREQSLALTKLEEAIFWANAAIARRT